MEQKAAGPHSGTRNVALEYLETMTDSSCWQIGPEEIGFGKGDELDYVNLVRKWSYCDRVRAPQKRMSLLPTWWTSEDVKAGSVDEDRGSLQRIAGCSLDGLEADRRCRC
jgi:hypothetical protein